MLGFFISLVFMVYYEGAKWPRFVELFSTTEVLQKNLVLSGMSFYVYNELATMTIKKTSAITGLVANTAKRVIVIVVAAVAFGETLTCARDRGRHTISARLT